MYMNMYISTYMQHTYTLHHVYLSIDVTAHVQQEFDGGRVTVHCSQHQRRDPQLAARSMAGRTEF